MPQTLHAIKIKQIYLKDASFQAPAGAAAFVQEWAPQINVDVDVDTNPLGTGLHEVSLRLAVVARTGGNTHYMIEIIQAGLFSISGYVDSQLERILRTVCPETLYPYAREAVDGLVLKGRFPALILEPIDFATTYVAR